MKRQVVEEIHKPAKISFNGRRVILKSLMNNLFQVDLLKIMAFSEENIGYKYILVVINCFSKFV